MIWGNGATFDNMILRNAYLATGQRQPWNFRDDVCFRTVKYLFPLKKEFQGVRHHALDDARNQAKYLIKAVKGKLR